MKPPPLSNPSPPPPASPGRPGTWPIGLLLLSLVAAALYVPLLANATYKPAGGGEAVMGQAFKQPSS
jgi:hypothetical protein